MLRKLTVRNYVLIDSLETEFPEGLVIITGQTGAGKSILLGALSLLLGAKADASMIGESSDNCVVEGEFEVPDEEGTLKTMLEDSDVDWDGGHLTIRRVVNPTGRSRSFVNDSPVSVQLLSSLSSGLIDIHSQHQTMLLSDRHFQMSLLDHFAGDGKLLDEYELSEDVAQVEREGSRLNLDWYWDVPERHGLLAEINYKGEILNGIRDIYRLTGPILAALGLLGWLLLCAERVRSLIRREKNETGLASWLAVTALLASYLVLLGGISYSEISGWNAILYWYLSGGYPVMTAFEVLAILFAWKEGRRMLRGK